MLLVEEVVEVFLVEVDMLLVEVEFLLVEVLLVEVLLVEMLLVLVEVEMVLVEEEVLLVEEHRNFFKIINIKFKLFPLSLVQRQATINDITQLSETLIFHAKAETPNQTGREGGIMGQKEVGTKGGEII